jgi:hypothetical protein
MAINPSSLACRLRSVCPASYSETSPQEIEMKRIAAAVSIATVALTGAPLAFAANDLAGGWTIERADPAPWSNDTDYQPYREAVPLYVGKRVVFGTSRIDGPELLACGNPQYVMKDYRADLLFQGGLGAFEQRGGKRAEDTATEMGFKSRPIRTLETGCEHSFDFHMSDRDHAAFALDNMIYWLKRDGAK